MFGYFKKKREEKEEARRADFLNALREQMDNVVREIEADRKLLILETLKKSIRDELAGVRAAAEKEAGVERSIAYVVRSSALAASVGMGAVFVELPDADPERELKARYILASSAPYTDALRGHLKSATAQSDDVLRGGVETIARSGLRGVLFNRFPGLKKRFARAVAGRATNPEEIFLKPFRKPPPSPS